MPVRSPLMSAKKSRYTRQEKLSAIFWSVTVLPVPVAPVIKPWRLAMPGKMEQTVSPRWAMGNAGAMFGFPLSRGAVKRRIRA